MDPAPYPEDPQARTDWIVARRPDLGRRRHELSVHQPSGWLVEREPDERGIARSGLTVFLTNRECPWRCLMCDLWQHTTLVPVPPGAITRQLATALSGAEVRQLSWLKLYNAGSFFDVGAIPGTDHPAVAELCRRFERVIVECHPALVGEQVWRFRDLLGATRLEVAMGLETAHPQVLARLNKRMTTADFARAAARLRANGVGVRAFVLVKPPFLDEVEALDWALRSVEFAFEAGANVVSLIPTRGGNGALEEMARAGQFAPPRLATFEAAFEQALQLRRGRVFADVWDLERFAAGEPGFTGRRARLEEMNLRQTVLPPVILASA